MATKTQPATRHRFKIVHDPRTDPRITPYARACTCGWVGERGQSHPPISIDDAIASV